MNSGEHIAKAQLTTAPLNEAGGGTLIGWFNESHSSVLRWTCLDKMLPLSSEAAATVERGRADVQTVVEVISFTAKHCA